MTDGPSFENDNTLKVVPDCDDDCNLCSKKEDCTPVIRPGGAVIMMQGLSEIAGYLRPPLWVKALTWCFFMLLFVLAFLLFGWKIGLMYVVGFTFGFLAFMSFLSLYA